MYFILFLPEKPEDSPLNWGKVKQINHFQTLKQYIRTDKNSVTSKNRQLDHAGL